MKTQSNLRYCELQNGLRKQACKHFRKFSVPLQGLTMTIFSELRRFRIIKFRLYSKQTSSDILKVRSQIKKPFFDINCMDKNIVFLCEIFTKEHKFSQFPL